MKILVISYYWPPAGGPGVQRVLRFVKHFAALGHELTILTVDDPSSPDADKKHLSSIPSGVRVIKTKTFEPFGLYLRLTGKKKDGKIPKNLLNETKSLSFKERVSRWIRANVFIPDARLGWYPYLVRAGVRVAREFKPDVIFSSSPPHSLQLAAAKISRKTKTPWVADYRDPWTQAYWQAELNYSKLSSWLNRRFERRTLASSDLNTTVSQGLVDMFHEISPNDYTVIHNGIDHWNTRERKVPVFRILFIGYLNKYQDPLPLFKALDMLENEVRDKIEIVFVGRITSEHEETILSFSERLKIRRLDYMPLVDLYEYAEEVSLLFNPQPQISYALGSVNAKTYDYLAMRKPILAMGNRRGVSMKIVEETGSGKAFEYENVEGAKSYIEEVFRKWMKGDQLLLPMNKSLEPYLTRSNVERLLDEVKRMLSKNIKV